MLARSGWPSRLMRWSLTALLTFYLFSCVVILGLKWVVVPQLAQYKPQLETVLTTWLARPVRIETLQASWVGWAPEIEIQNLTLANPAEPQGGLRLERLRARLAFRTFLTAVPRFDFVDVQGLSVNLTRDDQGRYWLAGAQLQSTDNSRNPALDWLLRQNLVSVQNAELVWTDYLASPESPPQWTAQLQAWVENHLGQHAIKLQANLPELLHEPMSLNATFATPLWALNLDDVSQWDGKFYGKLKAHHLKPLTQWMKAQDYALRLNNLDAEAWATFEDGLIEQGTLDLSVGEWSLDDKVAHSEAFRLNHTTAQLDLKGFEPAKLQGQLNIVQFKADLPNHQVVGPLDIQASRKLKEGSQHLSLALSQLDAGRLLHTARLILPHLRQSDWNEWVQHTEVDGQFDKLALTWTLPVSNPVPSNSSTPANVAPAVSPSFTANIEFHDLALYRLKPATKGKPALRTGFSGLKGQFVGNESHGKWQVEAEAWSLSLPELFERGEKTFSHLKGHGQWSDAMARLGPSKVMVDELRLANPDAEVTLKGAYAYNPKGSDYIDIQGDLLRADVSKVGDYLPLVVGAGARQWLQYNLKAGDAQAGHMVLRGALSQFPFAHKGDDGEFRIQARVANGALTYAPGWPAIAGVEGQLVFKGHSMLIEADRAHTQGVQLEQVRASIDNLGSADPLLEISGLGKGELQNMLGFVKTSPVGRLLNNALDEARGTGEAELKIKLTIPILKAEQTQVQGQLQLRNNTARLVHGMPEVKQLQGLVEFSNKGVQLKQVRGKALEAAVQVSGGTNAQGNLDIRATGMAKSEGLAEYLNPLLVPYLQGESAYEVNVTTQKNQLQVKVTSQLEGLALQLPKPFLKLAAEPMEFELTQTILADQDIWRARVGSVNNPMGLLKAVYLPQKSEDRLAMLNFAVGADLPADGLGVNGRLAVDTLDIDAWRALVDDVMGKLPKGQRIQTGLLSDVFAPTDKPLRMRVKMDLKARQVQYGKKAFKGMQVGVRHEDHRWIFDIKGQGLDGSVNWLTDAQRPEGLLQARFKTLTIPKSVNSELKEMVDEPVSSIPALDVKVDRLVVGDLDLGRLQLSAVNQSREERLQAEQADRPRVWRLQELRIENPESVTVAKGNWQYGKSLSNQLTSIDLQQEVSDAGGLLARFGMPGVFKGGKGSLTGQLSWNDAPSEIDYGSLSGQLKLTSKNGQFLKADPGVAKLLGVLSMQSLPRRLTLDFKDVFSDGFAYDSLDADITLTKGVGRTPNFKMISPAATVVVDGSFNLAKETQNLNVLVLPGLSPAGGSLIYSVIAANPAIGLASLVADYLLKDPLSKAFSFEYKVTGTWTQPEINRVGNNAPRTPNEPDQ